MNNTESIKYLYPHEKTALFRALEADQSAHCLRNRAIFYLAEYCGMRASEVGLVRLSDINLPAKEIHVHRLKKSNCNTLRIIDANVFDALRIYYIQMLQLTSSNPNQILFPSQKGTPISRNIVRSPVFRMRKLIFMLLSTPAQLPWQKPEQIPKKFNTGLVINPLRTQKFIINLQPANTKRFIVN